MKTSGAEKMKVRLAELNLAAFFVFILFQFCGGFVRSKKYEGGDTWLMPFVKKLPVHKQISWRKTESCKCGLAPNRNHTERIVGGVVSKRNAWPWMGAIVFVGDAKPKILCGASIINRRYLMTAGHCAEYLSKHGHGMDKFKVFLGTNDLNDTDAIVPEMDSVILHPKYNTDTKAYDVALIRLKVPLKFSARVAPICITPQSGAPYERTTTPVFVVGWGSKSFGGVSATMQMQTMVNITSNKVCSEKYLKLEEPIKITSMMICASAPGSDSCQGDSGGPLFLKRRGSASHVFEQIGIVSFGSGCADNRFPGVYTRLGKVLNWIKSATNDAMYCHTDTSG